MHTDVLWNNFLSGHKKIHKRKIQQSGSIRSAKHSLYIIQFSYWGTREVRVHLAWTINQIDMKLKRKVPCCAEKELTYPVAICNYNVSRSPLNIRGRTNETVHTIFEWNYVLLWSFCLLCCNWEKNMCNLLSANQNKETFFFVRFSSVYDALTLPHDFLYTRVTITCCCIYSAGNYETEIWSFLLLKYWKLYANFSKLSNTACQHQTVLNDGHFSSKPRLSVVFWRVKCFTLQQLLFNRSLSAISAKTFRASQR